MPSRDPRDAPAGAATAELRNIAYAPAGTALLDGLSLSLDGEGVTTLMGPNGAGKSLTLRLIAGLIAPCGGEVSLSADLRARVALVFQSPVLLRRSARANLDHALRVYEVPRAGRASRIAALLAQAGLSEIAHRPARALSGGEQQRLAMARALAMAPRLLLLDEPTASLDPASTAAIEGLILDAAQTGAKILLVTHDANQARRLARQIIFMHRGRVCEQTPADRFFKAPASKEARAYLAGRLLV